MILQMHYFFLHHFAACWWCIIIFLLELLIESKSHFWFFFFSNFYITGLRLNHFDIVNLFFLLFLWEILNNCQCLLFWRINYTYILCFFLNQNIVRIRICWFLWKVLYNGQNNFMLFIWFNLEIMNFFFLLSLK